VKVGLFSMLYVCVSEREREREREHLILDPVDKNVKDVFEHTLNESGLYLHGIKMMIPNS